MQHVLALVLVMATPAASDPVEEVRQAEIAFARAFAERNEERFFDLVADDATFLSGTATLRGKAEVRRVWSGFFKEPQAPFSWGPERVVVSGDGKLGLSFGPIYDARGRHAGFYNSTWRREADGSWKVVFDGPGAPPSVVTEAPRVEEGFITTPDGVRLHYRKTGRASQTVIVPLGFMLFDEVRQLADLATVITYDPRDRGRSDRPEKVNTLTIHQDVQDLEAVRAHFKVERFVPIGHSDFGLIAAMYAAEHPERVSRIIQLSPAPNHDGAEADIRQVTMPVLTIHGTRDRNAASGAGRQWALELPDARLVTVPGAARAVHRDDPVAVWSAVRQFLRGDWPLGAEKLTSPVAK